MEEPDADSLSTKPWISNPIVYVQKKAPKFFGLGTTTILRQISTKPTLFECALITSCPTDGKELKVFGVAASKRDAERLACIQLCRVIDELDAEEVELASRLASVALMQIHPEAPSRPWYGAPLQAIQKLKVRYGEFVTRFHDNGYMFIATIISQMCPQQGIGMSTTKKKASLFAAVDLCMKLDDEIIMSISNSTGVSSRDGLVKTQTPDDADANTHAEILEGYIAGDIEEVKSHPQYHHIKTYLNHWAQKTQRQYVTYSNDQIKIGKEVVFLSRAYISSIPGFVGKGSGGSLKGATRLAAAALAHKLGLFKDEQTQVIDVSARGDQSTAPIEQTLLTIKPNTSSDGLPDLAPLNWPSAPQAEVDRLSQLYSPGMLPIYEHCKDPRKAGQLFSIVRVQGIDNLIGEGFGEDPQSSYYYAALNFCQKFYNNFRIDDTLGTSSGKVFYEENSSVMGDSVAGMTVDPSRLVSLTVPNHSSPATDSNDSFKCKSSSFKKMRVNHALATHMISVSEKGGDEIREEAPVTIHQIKRSEILNVIRDKPVLISRIPGCEQVVIISKLGGIKLPSVSFRKVNSGKWQGRAILENIGKVGTSSYSSPSSPSLDGALGNFVHGFSLFINKQLIKALGKKKCSQVYDLAKKTPSQIVFIAAEVMTEPRRPTKFLHVECKEEDIVHDVLETPISVTKAMFNGLSVPLLLDEKSLDSLHDWLNEERNIGRMCIVQRTSHRIRADINEKIISEDLEITPDELSKRSISILKALTVFKGSPEGKASELFRNRFAIAKYFGQIKTALIENQVVILYGQAGSGMSTQVPGLILEQMISEGFGAQCNVLVVEPHEISAIALAKRAAQERSEPIGFKIGYELENDLQPPERFGSITYCTYDALLQKLKYNPMLFGYSHVVIDEIQERDAKAEIALSILKSLLGERPELRLILMGSVSSPAEFDHYFALNVKTAINVFMPISDVQTHFLDRYLLSCLDPRLLKAQDATCFIESELDKLSPTQDLVLNVPYSLLEALIGRICESTDTSESILVLLPGLEELATFNRCLRDEDILKMDYYNLSKYRIHMVHPNMDPLGYANIFSPPSHGVRKIILATSIVVSCIGINDIFHVVDSAKIKQSLAESQLTIHDFSCRWIGKNRVDMHKNLAGRNPSGGHYYLLMSERRYKQLEEDIVSISTQQAYLFAKRISYPLLSPEKLIANCISIDRLSSGKAFCAELNVIGALEGECLSSMGYLMSLIPMEPILSKLLLYGMLLKCLDPALVIASSRCVGKPFIHHGGYNIQSETMGYMRDASDHLAAWYAYQDWRSERAKFRNQQEELAFASKQGLHLSILLRIHQHKQQLFTFLQTSGILSAYVKIFSSLDKIDSTPEEIFGALNKNSTKPSIIKAAIAAAFYPKIGCSYLNTANFMITGPLRDISQVHAYSAASISLQSSDRFILPDPKTQKVLIYAFEDLDGKEEIRRAMDVSRIGPAAALFFGVHHSIPFGEAWNSSTLLYHISRGSDLVLPNLVKFVPGGTKNGKASFDETIKHLKVAADISFQAAFSRLEYWLNADFRAPKGHNSDYGEVELISFIHKIIETVITLIESLDSRV